MRGLNTNQAGRIAAPNLNPAGRAFSHEDHTNGTMTISGNQAQLSPDVGTLELATVSFRFHQLPNDPAGVLFELLTHPELEAFDQTSRGCSQLLASHPVYSLTRQALTTGSLRLTRQLMERLQQRTQAGDTLNALRINSQLSGSTHMSAVRETEIRSILETGSSHQDCQALLHKCDFFLAQLVAGEALDHNAVMEVVHTPGLGLINDWLLTMALDDHANRPDAATAVCLRNKLDELKKEVLVLTGRAIAGP